MPQRSAPGVSEKVGAPFSRLRNGFALERAETYVRRAIASAYLDRGRRATRWRRIAHLQARPESVEPADGDVDLHIDLRAQLDPLSPRERACTVWRYYDDLKVDDIANRLGIAGVRVMAPGLLTSADHAGSGDNELSTTECGAAQGPAADHGESPRVAQEGPIVLCGPQFSVPDDAVDVGVTMTVDFPSRVTGGVEPVGGIMRLTTTGDTVVSGLGEYALTATVSLVLDSSTESSAVIVSEPRVLTVEP